MKVDDIVNYYDRDHGVRPRHARVIRIGEAGPSLAKTLDLRIKIGDEDLTLENVPHGTNATSDDPFWLIPGLERVPHGWMEQEGEEPVVPTESTTITPPVVIANAKEATKATRRR